VTKLNFISQDIVEEFELQPGQEIPEHLKQYVTSIEERVISHLYLFIFFRLFLQYVPSVLSTTKRSN
jgi:hypothetical protein